jgi:hypothetical protein
MTETTIVIDSLSLDYEGLFNAKDFYKLLDNFFGEKNYDKREVLSMEKVESKGKYVELEIEPYRKITDYAKLVVRVRTKMFNVKEVEVEKDGHKLRLNQGKVSVVIDGFVQTDYENRWTDFPIRLFLKTIYDKFIYKKHTDEFDAKLKEDVGLLHNQIKAFFNLYRY